jgi:uncharacterized membrane protein
MNDIENFIHKLESALSKAPGKDAGDVIEYYREYIDDAQKEGLSDKEILLKIGSPYKIANASLAEAIIQSTNIHPGPVSLIRTSGKVYSRGVARAAKSMSLGLLSIFPMLSALIFYISSVVFGVASLAGASFLAYSIIINPSPVVSDKLGQAGLILTIFCVCLFAAWAFWKCANLLTKATMYLFKKMLNKTKAENPDLSQETNKKRPALKALGITIAGLLIIGLTLSSAGGLFPKYFAFWNSQKPDNTAVVEKSFASTGLTKIYISTLNSNIEVISSEDETVGITYEQPPYFKFDSKNDNDTLLLQETSNGRLPLIDYFSIHEGMTKMTVKLPQSMKETELYLTTKGGDIEIKAYVKSVNAYTYSGNITIHTPDGSYSGKLESTTGKVEEISDGTEEIK